MTGLLLDTNVVSELVRSRPEPKVVEFVARAIDPWLSSVTLHELTYGAERLPNSIRKAKLETWIASLIDVFDGRVRAVDWAIAERSGRLRASAAARGNTVFPMDAMIASTALVCGLTLVSRNAKDFQALGIEVLDPWSFPN